MPTEGDQILQVKAAAEILEQRKRPFPHLVLKYDPFEQAGKKILTETPPKTVRGFQFFSNPLLQNKLFTLALLSEH